MVARKWCEERDNGGQVRRLRNVTSSLPPSCTPFARLLYLPNSTQRRGNGHTSGLSRVNELMLSPFIHGGYQFHTTFLSKVLPLAAAAFVIFLKI